MQSSIAHLIGHALNLGHSVEVFDCEDQLTSGLVDPDTDKAFLHVMEAIESVDECSASFYTYKGRYLGTAYLVNGVEPDERVQDFPANRKFFTTWETLYQESVNADFGL